MVEANGVPSFFFQGFNIGTLAFEVELSFAAKVPGTGSGQDNPIKNRPVAYGVTSLGHAKLMAMVLKRAIKMHEEKFGKIAVSPEVFRAHGLSEQEDW